MLEASILKMEQIPVSFTPYFLGSYYNSKTGVKTLGTGIILFMGLL